MTDLKEIVRSLHPLERKLLPYLKKFSLLNDLIKNSKLQEVEVMRALQWLQNKNVAIVNTETKQQIDLDLNGQTYKTEGLPERKFVNAISKEPKTLNQLEKETKLTKNELNSCMGLLRKKGLIEIKKEKEIQISLTKNGEQYILDKHFPEEHLLKKEFPLNISELNKEEKQTFEELKKRNILLIQEIKNKSAKLTETGQKLLEQDLQEDSIDTVTSKMLKDQSWKGKQFRKYDVKTSVPKIQAGKRHFVKQAIQYARQIWLEMGFQEMQGPIIQTSFWNFDALFTAQDHPVREMQDTFFIKKPSKGKLPDKKITKQVQDAHENGGKTKSTGWEYSWNSEEAKKNVLRTHTTVLSAQTIAKLKETDLPAKFFNVGRCFRNEAIDWCHLAEFNQTEGIVIDPNANFKQLLGYLKEFFKKMGFPKARFRPAFFPYTSPSVEIDVFHPVRKKWIEFGGAGIFRPEVIVPLLGKDIPVLAWGPGFDRIILDYYKITDIRELYKNDIKTLRETKAWLK